MCRQGAPFFLELATEYYGPRVPHHDADIMTVVNSLNEIYLLFDRSPMFLDATCLAALETLTLDFGTAYQRLRENSRVSGQLMWQVKHKLHMMQHMP